MRTRPMGRGTRVRHVAEPSLVGKIVRSQQRGNRWTYFVRWDGYEHDSGEYGIRSIERVSCG
jgi:hypothetical protein